MLLAICLRNCAKHALETWPPILLCRRKIRSAEEGLAIRREKGCERPSTLPGQRADCCLVSTVDVGTLISTHLYCDEILIDDFRYLRIVIRFPVHHVAPVTPDRPNVEKHRLVFALGLGESFFAPLMPQDWLVHCRPQVGRRCLGQGVEGSSHQVRISF